MKPFEQETIYSLLIGSSESSADVSTFRFSQFKNDDDSEDIAADGGGGNGFTSRPFNAARV